MSRPLAPIVCDGPGCTNRKQESNHWWTIEVVILPVAGQGKQIARMVVFPGTSPTPELNTDPLYDFCGQDCALKFLSEQMGKVTS
jgi:hypothetical protein